jgi:hypothetical protein
LFRGSGVQNHRDWRRWLGPRDYLSGARCQGRIGRRRMLSVQSEHLLYQAEEIGHTARLLYANPKANSDHWVDRSRPAWLGQSWVEGVPRLCLGQSSQPKV